MSEDTPEYFERPECEGCVMRVLKHITNQADQVGILEIKQEQINQLTSALDRLRQRHQQLLCQLGKINGGNHGVD